MKTYKITRRFFGVVSVIEAGLSKDIAEIKAAYLSRQPANRYFVFRVEGE